MTLRVSIDKLQPEAACEIHVPADTTLAGLHAIVQAVFLWENRHVYRFKSPGGAVYSPVADKGQTPGTWTSLATALGEGNRLEYSCGPLASWLHTIEVVDTDRRVRSTARLLRTSGRAPFEECESVEEWNELGQIVREASAGHDLTAADQELFDQYFYGLDPVLAREMLEREDEDEQALRQRLVARADVTAKPAPIDPADVDIYDLDDDEFDALERDTPEADALEADAPEADDPEADESDVDSGRDPDWKLKFNLVCLTKIYPNEIFSQMVDAFFAANIPAPAQGDYAGIGKAIHKTLRAIPRGRLFPEDEGLRTEDELNRFLGVLNIKYDSRTEAEVFVRSVSELLIRIGVLDYDSSRGLSLSDEGLRLLLLPPTVAGKRLVRLHTDVADRHSVLYIVCLLRCLVGDSILRSRAQQKGTSIDAIEADFVDDLVSLLWDRNADPAMKAEISKVELLLNSMGFIREHAFVAGKIVVPKKARPIIAEIINGFSFLRFMDSLNSEPPA